MNRDHPATTQATVHRPIHSIHHTWIRQSINIVRRKFTNHFIHMSIDHRHQATPTNVHMITTVTIVPRNTVRHGLHTNWTDSMWLSQSIGPVTLRFPFTMRDTQKKTIVRIEGHHPAAIMMHRLTRLAIDPRNLNAFRHRQYIMDIWIVNVKNVRSIITGNQRNRHLFRTW